MTIDSNPDLISQKEAAQILGFKQTRTITEYIKAGILTKLEKPGSKLIWICKKQVLQLPEPLPVPPPKNVFKQLKMNEKWKKD
jgi:hypothetical protein